QRDQRLGILLGKFVVSLKVFGQAAERFVRRAKPYHGEERFALFSSTPDELDGFANQDVGAFALEDHGIATIPRERRVELKEIVVREPFVESHLAGVGGRFGLHRPDMPLAKVAAMVAGLTQNM